MSNETAERRASTLTVSEATDAAECVERTIRRAIKRGKLRSKLVDGAHAIDAESFAEWNAGRAVTRDRAEQTRASYEALARVYTRRRFGALHNFAGLATRYLEAFDALSDEKPDAREFDSACEASLRAAADEFATLRALAEEARDAYAAAQEAHVEAKIIFDVERADIDATYNEALAALTEEAERAEVDIF